ncbi:hypothetical protein ACFQY4_35185 [Catellatospora bangladeshensis]|uniref:Uncharacterized protein n=1 Tax=Catellatospora bangladeshensis TaxID=310355 RepID=A0A8J3NH49_9ACTN|nr:hypothetical protein [Catellatospora bangladeshensis]GIF80892.1 hypothetical protein Cba03nite_22410 [Catellatospora bangladeshensis]
MLKPAWYLTDTDWFAQLADAPRLHPDGQAVIGQVAELFGDESYFNPAKTVATVHVMLLAAEHLGDVITHTAAQHDLAQLARLVGGLNLVQAHLTQIVQGLAEHINRHAFAGSATIPAAAAKALTDCLSQAGASGEVAAGYLKETHLSMPR